MDIIKSKIRRYWARKRFFSLSFVALVHTAVMFMIFRAGSRPEKQEPVQTDPGQFRPFLLLDDQPLRSAVLNEQRFQKVSVSLFNVSDFKFVANHPNTCDSRSDIRSIVLIHTAPKHFERRDAIRRTWASRHAKVVPVVFLVGQTENPDHRKRLAEEIYSHQDLVQGSFIDHYHNLTYKYIMGLLWTRIYCRQVSVILKGDDDIFVNMPRYLKLIDDLQKPDSEENDGKILSCYEVVEGGVVRRSANSKWSVPVNEYPYSKFPKYCPGAVVILNNQVIDDIIDSVNYKPYVWVDDAYVTGVLASGKVEPKKLDESYICRRLPHKANETLIQQFKKAAFGPLQLSVKEMYRLWSVLG